MTETIPWPFARRVGGLVAGTHPLAESYLIEHLAAELPRIVESVNQAVECETRLPLPGRPDVIVVTRREWVERNVEVFSAMLSPVERKLSDQISRSGADGPTLAKRVVAGQTGALLGFLARRVLGQYELVLPGGSDGDSIAFVGANLLHLEREHQLRPSEFRTWVALHETAHRAQFVGVPWMRSYFQSLVAEMVETVEPDNGRVTRLIGEAMRSRRKGEPIIDERGLFGFLAAPGQRESLDRIQALMSLLEGHGHAVMNRLGEQMLVSPMRMASLLKARRSDPKTATFFRLTGLELKMLQYDEGERFVHAIERRAGWEKLDLAWTEPAALPTLEEIKDPGRWLRRVA